MVEFLTSSQEIFAVQESRRNFPDFNLKTSSSSSTTTCRSAVQASASGLSFIKGDELDKRLSLDFQPSSSNSSELSAFPASSSSPPPSPTGNSLLLIDLRSLFQYHESHVRQSINLTNCALVSKRIQDGKLQIKEYLEARVMFDGTQDVVIYEQGGLQDTEGEPDQEMEDGSGVTDFARLIFRNLTKVKSNSAKIEILRGGFDSFRKKYPRHCTQGVPLISRFMFINCNDDEMAFLNWEASEIRENLFVGALHDAQNDELLDRLGITHILNCCKTNSRQDDRSGKYQYLELLCDDNLQQSLDDKLGPAFKFIDSVMQKSGAKVLIHCYAGISRSAAITIAYMMYKMGMSYEESYKELKLKRSIVAPNINFVSQLMKYDEERQRAKQNLRLSSITSFANNRNDTSANDSSFFPQRVESLNDMRSANQGVDGRNSFGKFQRKDHGKEFAQKKISFTPCIQAKTPAVFPGGRLAAKRKMLLPMPIKLSIQSEGNPGALIAASAPIISNEFNPFASAFKKANSECGDYSFATKMDSLSE